MFHETRLLTADNDIISCNQTFDGKRFEHGRLNERFEIVE